MKANRVAALALVALPTACTITSALVNEASGGSQNDLVTLQLPALLFAYIGAVILDRRPENRMGWLMGAVGWFVTSGGLADAYASYALGQPGDPSSAAVLAAWYSEWFWIPFIFIAFGLSITLFPNGHPPSRRWRPYLWVVTTLIFVLTICAMFDSTLEPSGGNSVANPIGISPKLDPDNAPLNSILLLSMWLITGGALISLVQRFRRARGEERQQLKWFSFTASITVIGFLLIGALDGIFSMKSLLLEVVVFSGVPVGIGIAILRFRLYDIDIVVNRTIVYGLLSLLLTIIYIAGITLLQGVLGLEQQGDVAVAASTLAVAGLFQPLRRRVQDFIDHYFYRRKYDAQKTIDEFSEKLRDEIDLESLEGELVGVVSRTMQPTHVSVWLPVWSEG